MTTRAEVAEHIRRMRRPQLRIGRSGSPPFHATAETKALVKALAGMRLTRIEICKLVINPHTQRPISIDSLNKYFRPELEAGWAALKGLVGRRYIEALNAGQVWAIQAGLRQLFGWKNYGRIVTLDTAPPNSGDDDDAIAEFERLLDRIRAARTIDGSATEVRQDTGADVVPLSPRRNA